MRILPQLEHDLVVLSVGLFGHVEAIEGRGALDKETKKMLDELHLRKIDLASEILVINVGDYIGASTKKEIAYAKSKGKTVRYLESHSEHEKLFSPSFTKMNYARRRKLVSQTIDKIVADIKKG